MQQIVPRLVTWMTENASKVSPKTNNAMKKKNFTSHQQFPDWVLWAQTGSGPCHN